MPRWDLSIQDDTDRVVRDHLSQRGTDNSLAAFVDAAVRQRVFWETVDDIQEKNAQNDPGETERVIQEAVDWSRANRP